MARVFIKKEKATFLETDFLKKKKKQRKQPLKNKYFV